MVPTQEILKLTLPKDPNYLPNVSHNITKFGALNLENNIIQHKTPLILNIMGRQSLWSLKQLKSRLLDNLLHILKILITPIF